MAEIKNVKKSSPPAHPSYVVMITTAIKELKERKGSSNKAILKYVKEQYKVGPQLGSRLNAALRKLVEQDKLTRVKGMGARGVFEINKEDKTVDKKPRGRPAGKKTLVTESKPQGRPAGIENKPKETNKTLKPKAKAADSKNEPKETKKTVKPKAKPADSKNKPK